MGGQSSDARGGAGSGSIVREAQRIGRHEPRERTMFRLPSGNNRVSSCAHLPGGASRGASAPTAAASARGTARAFHDDRPDLQTLASGPASAAGLFHATGFAHVLVQVGRVRGVGGATAPGAVLHRVVRRRVHGVLRFHVHRARRNRRRQTRASNSDEDGELSAALLVEAHTSRCLSQRSAEPVKNDARTLRASLPSSYLPSQLRGRSEVSQHDDALLSYVFYDGSRVSARARA